MKEGEIYILSFVAVLIFTFLTVFNIGVAYDEGTRTVFKIFYAIGIIGTLMWAYDSAKKARARARGEVEKKRILPLWLQLCALLVILMMVLGLMLGIMFWFAGFPSMGQAANRSLSTLFFAIFVLGTALFIFLKYVVRVEERWGIQVEKGLPLPPPPPQGGERK